MELSSVDGPSGMEDLVLEKIERIVGDGFKTKLGGLVYEVKGGNEKKIGIFAHTDEISLVVSKDAGNGFFYLETVGGVDPKILPASRVKVYTRSGIVKGVIGIMAPHITPPEKKGKVQGYDELLLDASMSNWEKIRIGDRVILDVNPCEMNGKVCGKALDNRAGCASLILASERLKKLVLRNNVFFVFSSMEEVGGPGAKSVAHQLRLDYAVVVDVTFAEDTGHSQKIEIGKGPAIGIGPFIDRDLVDLAVSVAKENNIPHQIEPLPGRTGTDVDSIRRAWIGIRTLLLSIPLLHMHTPVEIVDPKDIEETARLIAHLAAAI